MATKQIGVGHPITVAQGLDDLGMDMMGVGLHGPLGLADPHDLGDHRLQQAVLHVTRGAAGLLVA